MSIKFSELRGLLKDTKINTVRMSDPAYNIQLAQCTNNNWNIIFKKIERVNFLNLNKLKMMDRLDVVCLFCPSEINLWVNTTDKYQRYEDDTPAYFFFKYNDLGNLDTELNRIIPKINRKPLLSLFYVMNPTNGGALSGKEGVQKDFNGARIMNYGHYFDTQLPFNDIPQVWMDGMPKAQLVIEVKPQIMKQNGQWNVLIGLGYKPDDDFSYSDRCDISFWLDYGTNGYYSMFSDDSFTNRGHIDYRYGVSGYFEKFNSMVINNE